MISEELFHCIGNIDDTLIGDSEKALRSVKIRRTAAGACSCAAAVLALFMLPAVLINFIGASSADPNGGAPPNEWVSTSAPGYTDGKQNAADPPDGEITGNQSDGVKPLWVYEINGSLYEVCENEKFLREQGIEKSADISMAGEYIGEFHHSGYYPTARVYTLEGWETQNILIAEIDGNTKYLVRNLLEWSDTP